MRLFQLLLGLRIQTSSCLEQDFISQGYMVTPKVWDCLVHSADMVPKARKETSAADSVSYLLQPITGKASCEVEIELVKQDTLNVTIPIRHFHSRSQVKYLQNYNTWSKVLRAIKETQGESQRNPKEKEIITPGLKDIALTHCSRKVFCRKSSRSLAMISICIIISLHFKTQ